MEWVERTFTAASQQRVGVYDTRYEDDGHLDWNKDSRSREEEEDDDLDHAIAVSLSEADYRRAGGYSTEIESDEDLARALQASWNLDEPVVQHSCSPLFYFSSRKRVCEGCKNEICSGRFFYCMGSFWHPQCFCCHACDTPISDRDFSVWRDKPYHKGCYRDLFHPKCDVCKEFIPTNYAGLIEYRAHPFWGQKYCPSHEKDSTPRCCSCERVESMDSQYISLGDGRKLCLECLDSSIMDTGECQPLYHEIRDFYEGMNMRIKQQIPMLLVERQALNEAMEGEKEGHHHMPETRGICLSEEQTVSWIIRRPSIGFGNQLLDIITRPQQLSRECEVTAILALYGLPRLLTGSILAHELMHGWLRLNGFRNLPPDVEEGICQVLAHMWLESEVMAGSSSSSSSKNYKAPRSAIEKKLGEFFLYQIAMEPSPVYGEGFRAGHSAMVQYGLRRTLDHIKLTCGFPV